MSNADTHVVSRDAPIEGKEVEELRVAVGWDRCENKYDGILANSYAHFSVRHANRLAGFLNVISDGSATRFCWTSWSTRMFDDAVWPGRWFKQRSKR